MMAADAIHEATHSRWVLAARAAFEKQAHESLVGRQYALARVWFVAGYLDAIRTLDALDDHEPVAS